MHINGKNVVPSFELAITAYTFTEGGNGARAEAVVVRLALGNAVRTEDHVAVKRAAHHNNEFRAAQAAEQSPVLFWISTLTVHILLK